MLSQKVQPVLWAVLGLIATWSASARSWAAPLGTAFTFQGQLKEDGAPAPDGPYQMSFILYDGPEPLTATQLGTVGPLSVTVADGLFSQPLDFGPTPFDGNAVWLRLFVEGTPLSPLQEITAGPYALFALDGAGAGVSPWEVNGSDLYYTAGNVGVGETSPQAKLHVRTQDLAMSSIALENDEVIVEGQDAVLGLYSSEQGNFGSAIALKQISAGALVDTWGMARLTSAAPGTPSALRFTYGASDNYATNPAHLTISNDGNVGIGTTNPGIKFHVFGGSDATLTSGGYILAGSTAGTNVVMDDNEIMARNNGATATLTLNNEGGNVHLCPTGTGNVGIGTNTTTARLNVKGDTHVTNTHDERTVEIISDTSPSAPTGSEIRLYKSGTANPSITIDSHFAGGSMISMQSSAGSRRIDLDARTSGAVVDLYDGSGVSRIRLDADDNGSGRIITDVLQINGADLSEQFDVGGAHAVVPGMVVSIDPAHPGKLTIATEAYDKKVAGIISGAGGVRTGLVMGQEGTLAHGEHAVALTGRVWCQVDAGFGAIEPGDPLTTSTTLGHAMKASDHDRARGAVIGKAMTALTSGKGMVLVLVQPQ